MKRCTVHFVGILDAIVAILMAFMFTIAPSYINTGSFVFSGRAIGTMIFYAIVFLCLTGFCRWMLSRSYGNKLVAGANAATGTGKLDWLERILNHKHSLIILTIIMFLLWLPTLICLYPGTAINDTWGQLARFVYTFYSDGSLHFEYLGDHHPAVSTMIIGCVIIPLTSVTGNLQVSFFIYVLIQSFLTCLAFSYTVLYMWNNLKVGTGFTLAAFLIYCFLPLYPSSSQLIAKDSLSAWLFVYFTVFIIEIVRTRGEWLGNNFNRYIFLIVTWLCCATKKVGIYVTLITLIILAVTVFKNRKRLLLYSAGFAVAFLMLWPMMMNTLHITGGGKTEMLSIPFQMTARYVKENPDDITAEEYQAIDKILYITDLPTRYNPVSADPVKGFAFYERFQNSDYVDYLKAWASMGLRHPDAYLNALLAQESGWFSWAEYVPLLNMDWHSQLNTQIFNEEVTVRPEKIKKVADKYQGMIGRLYKVPVIDALFTYGLWAALLPAFIITTLFRRKRVANGQRHVSGDNSAVSKQSSIHPWVSAVPMLLSIALGCWLAPVSIHFEGRRYLFPVTYTVIVLLAFCRWWMMGGSNADLDMKQIPDMVATVASVGTTDAGAVIDSGTVTEVETVTEADSVTEVKALGTVEAEIQKEE